MTRREAEWDDESRAEVLALLLWESTQCKGCGGDLTETTKPENENRYVAQLPVRCHRCDEVEAANEIIFDEKNGHRRPRALMVPIEHHPLPVVPVE